MTDAPLPTAGQEIGATRRRASPATGARRRRAPSPKVTVVAALAGFIVVFELLAYQLRSGHDPAIGGRPLTAQVRPGSATVWSGQPSASSGALVTRASGGTTAGAPASSTPAAGARAPRVSSDSITTRSSGGGGSAVAPTSGDDAHEVEGALR
jgi:hypothetical protein